MAKPSKPKAAPSKADALNEQARLYPWRLFNQGELEDMTSVPREAVAAAFDAPDFPAQFGRSRPEDLFDWVRAQDRKKQTKDLAKSGPK